jgi:hypothetical protein
MGLSWESNSYTWALPCVRSSFPEQPHSQFLPHTLPFTQTVFNPTPTSCRTWIPTIAQGLALHECNEYSQIEFIDCSLFLIGLGSLNGPGGLLFVVSHLFTVLVLIWWGGGVVKNLITKTWMREIFLQRSHTKHRWRCSKLSGCCISQLFLVLKYLLQEGEKESENSNGWWFRCKIPEIPWDKNPSHAKIHM